MTDFRPIAREEILRLMPCVSCGHIAGAHHHYSRCDGTLAQPQCSCELTPEEVASPPCMDHSDAGKRHQ